MYRKSKPGPRRKSGMETDTTESKLVSLGSIRKTWSVSMPSSPTGMLRIALRSYDVQSPKRRGGLYRVISSHIHFSFFRCCQATDLNSEGPWSRRELQGPQGCNSCCSWAIKSGSSRIMSAL